MGRYGETGPEERGKEEGRQPGDGRGRARDSVLLGLCWDDWLVEGGRELVGGLMGR